MRFNACLILLFLGCSHLASAQDVPVVKFDAVEAMLQPEDNKITVINFWATWCAPCIKEMPYFEQVLAERNPEINLHFISLDYADQKDRVETFIERKGIQGDVVILDELDYNSWIDKVEPTWSGAIPATLFLNASTGERIFVESTLTHDEINQFINQLLH